VLRFACKDGEFQLIATLRSKKRSERTDPRGLGCFVLPGKKAKSKEYLVSPLYILGFFLSCPFFFLGSLRSPGAKLRKTTQSGYIQDD
jgi:hypothetical protein